MNEYAVLAGGIIYHPRIRLARIISFIEEFVDFF